MEIINAWILEASSTRIIIELPDGSLKHFQMKPYRQITEADLEPYRAAHPRKCKGQPLPTLMYDNYGLSKSNETRSELLHIRLTPTESERLKSAAEAAGLNVSEFAREWVREL